LGYLNTPNVTSDIRLATAVGSGIEVTTATPMLESRHQGMWVRVEASNTGVGDILV